MDESALREHIAGAITEAKEALRRIDEERLQWLTVLQGYEGVARLHGWSTAVAPTLPSPAESPPLVVAAQPRITLKAAIRTALSEAGGHPMHATALLRRARELGAESNADRPETVVDALAGQMRRSGEPIEKTKPLTWRWVGRASHRDPAIQLSPTSTTPKGQISIRRALVQVLREARGEPLHIEEVAARIRALGAVTTAKRPGHILDLAASSLSKRDGFPLERTAPKTWRWAGSLNGNEPHRDVSRDEPHEHPQEELPLN